MVLASPVLRLLRIRQWAKNLLVFAPLIFAQKFSSAQAWTFAFIAFVAFSFASSAGYILNDWIDRDLDRLHPVKKLRPIASDTISPRAAFIIASLLTIFAFAFAFAVNRALVVVLLVYALSSILYSVALKNLAIIELLLVSLNYVLRVVAGAVALPVRISPWLLVGTFLLALVIVIGKRRAEISASDARPVLGSYNSPLLDLWLAVASACAIVSYAIYSFQAHPNVPLYYTLPFVIFGIFRYLFLVLSRGLGGSPDRDLLTDSQLLATVFLWVVATILIFQFFSVE